MQYGSVSKEYSDIENGPELLPTALTKTDNTLWNLGIICLIIASLSFSIMSLLVTYISLSVPIYIILLSRSIIQTVLALIGCKVVGKSPWVFDTNELLLLVISRGFVGSLSTLMRFASVSMIPLGESMAIHGTHSVFSLLFSWTLLHQPIRPYQILTVLAVSIGVFLLTDTQESSTTLINGKSKAYGVIFALCGSLMASWVYITVTKAGDRAHWCQLTLWYGICGIIVSTAMCLIYYYHSWMTIHLSIANFITMVLIGFISFIGQTMFNIGLQFTSSAVTSSIVRQLDVVFGFILQLYIQHNPISTSSASGTAIIVIALIMESLFKNCFCIPYNMVYVHKGPMSLDDYIKMNRFRRLIYQLRYDPRRVLDLTLLLVSLFVEWCGTALVAPLTPWLVQDLDPSMDEGSAASIFMASFSLGTLIASLVTGPLSDKFGRRPIFLGAMLIYTISYFLVANAWDIASFAGFRALGGVSAGTRPVLYAFITDSSRQEDMRFYGSCISICNTVGGALGPTIGGWLASVGMSFPFYFMGVVAAILFILEFLFLRETKPWENKPKWLTLEYYECWKHHRTNNTNVTDDDDDTISNDATVASGNEQQHSAPETPEKALSPMDQAKDMSLGKWSKKNKWFIPTLVCLCLAAFAGQYTGNSWSTVFGVLGADRYHLSEQENGEAMGIQAVVVIVCTILYIYVSDKIRPGMVAAFGFCLVVLAVIVPFIYSLWGTIVIGMCVYVGVTFFFAGMAYCSALISPPKSRGLINSISMGMTNVGGVLGPLVGGQLYDLNVADPYYVMCGLGVLGIASSIVITGGTTYTEKLLGVNSS